VPNRRVFLMYCAAFSNLSSHIAEDENDLCGGAIPAVGSADVLLVYAHHVAPTGDYSTPTNPVLFRVYKDLQGKQRRDTLTVYPDTDVSSSVEVLHKVLSEVKDKFPASSYGLLFTSHATGWLPVGFNESYSEYDIWGALRPRANPQNFRFPEKVEYPLTKCMGIEYSSGSGIDTRDLADALPMKLDFFLMDACLMGGIEIAYELKDKCKYLVFSPTEILSNGFMYHTMAGHLMNTATPDIKRICEEYYEFYNAQSGVYKSATITMVDCSKVDALAQVCKDIVSSHRDGLEAIDRNAVQPYFYYNYSDTLPWFYDLRDVMEKAGATVQELSLLDAALDECLVYKAATDSFFGLKLERVCGLSMYLPYPNKLELNNYYKTLSWNKATGLIQ